MSITLTLVFQLIVFLILVWFTMNSSGRRSRWPWTSAPRRSARASRPPRRAKAELATANKRVEEQLAAARTDATQRLADAERLAQTMVEEPRRRASDEGAKIIAAARRRPSRKR